MENQDHKFTTTPSGHESHAPYLCHKCSWPFPNPHPSARHRRAHKKVCGKVEGYKLSESEAADNSTHSAVSDDEHHSDGDQQTPSPKGEKASLKQISSIGSCRSEDEAFTDAVTEFSDSGISSGMEESLDDFKGMGTNVKADETGGISGSLSNAAVVNDLESFESAINQPEAAKFLGTIGDTNHVKSEKPVDASLQEINTTGSAEAKQVLMSSVLPNDLKGIEDINTGEGYVDAVDGSAELSQSVASATDSKTSNNEIYESQPQEEEGKNSDPLSMPSDLLGAYKTVSSPMESNLEADEQVTGSVPIEADLQKKDKQNLDPADLKLDLSEATVSVLDIANVDKEQEQLDMVEHDKQRISIQSSPLVEAPNAPMLELEADSSKKIDGGSQTEFSDSTIPGEGREVVHVVSLAKDTPAIDNPEILLKDFKDHNKFKSSFPLDVGSSEVIYSADDDTVDAAEVSQSFVDTGRPDGSISSVALDVSGDQVSEEKVVVSAEGKIMDSSGFVSASNTLECGVSSIPDSNDLKESEDSSKNSLPSGIPTDHSDVNTIISSDEHEKARPAHPIVAGGETEERRLEAVSESDKAISSVVGHNDHDIDTTVHESRDEIFHEASKDNTISNDAKLLESTIATGLDSKVVIDCNVKEPTGLLADTDSNIHVVDNSHNGDGLKSATGVISSASQNEGNDKLIKQNDTVSAADISMNSSSRTDSLDANWGSVSVLSTQSESTAVPDAEATDARGLEKAERDLQKPTSGAEECHPDKSDVYEPPSFMTLVESSVSADKKAAASEIETQLNAQQPKTEALKAGWFPSITNVVNESQGRKKNEEIIAKVTNWSTGKQHTPLKNLLGEAKSPNAKQVPSVNNKDESATKKNGATVTTVNSILSSEAPTDQAARKEVEKEWNSPARYPVDIKKEKRKSKPYWVPFVCCSSVHQDA